MNPHERRYYDVLAVPLTMAERDTFARLTAKVRCRFCRKAATGACGCCCPEHDTPPAPRVTRYDTRLPARLRALGRRVARSPFADDLHRAYRAAFWPAAICSGLIVGLALVYLTRDVYVTWTGVYELTPGSTR